MTLEPEVCSDAFWEAKPVFVQQTPGIRLPVLEMDFYETLPQGSNGKYTVDTMFCQTQPIPPILPLQGPLTRLKGEQFLYLKLFLSDTPIMIGEFPPHTGKYATQAWAARTSAAKRRNIIVLNSEYECQKMASVFRNIIPGDLPANVEIVTLDTFFELDPSQDVFSVQLPNLTQMDSLPPMSSQPDVKETSKEEVKEEVKEVVEIKPEPIWDSAEGDASQWPPLNPGYTEGATFTPEDSDSDASSQCGCCSICNYGSSNWYSDDEYFSEEENKGNEPPLEAQMRRWTI